MLTKIRNRLGPYGIALGAILLTLTTLAGAAVAASAHKPGCAPKATYQSTPGPGNPYGGGGYRPPASR